MRRNHTPHGVQTAFLVRGGWRNINSRNILCVRSFVFFRYPGQPPYLLSLCRRPPNLPRPKDQPRDIVKVAVLHIMADDQEERREIEAYLGQHHLQTFIGDAVNDIVKERPKDPLSKLGDALRACSEVSRQIQKVHGRQILNGEALPALEIEIRTGQVCTEQQAVSLAVAGQQNNSLQDVHPTPLMALFLGNIPVLLYDRMS